MRYKVIYCDVPWDYKGHDQHDKTQFSSSAEKHYNTLKDEQLKQLPINSLSDDNSVLFFWTTSPMLERAFPIVSAWGFKYKASMVWDKVKHNVGYYVSVRHELLLICTKGSFLPINRKLFDSVYSEERTIHSKKPDFFYEVIDTIYPDVPKIELFARHPKPRANWSYWGDEA